MIDKHYCEFCGEEISKEGHYYCTGYQHFISSSQRIATIKNAFCHGARNAAILELKYFRTELNVWIEELERNEIKS